MFANSREAVLHLAQLADEMGFNLIFKPHPAMIIRAKREKWPENVQLVTNVDINALIDLADAVVTIVTQTGYVACIREKAVLTLGYNQLRGKGATYEAYTKEQIPQALQDAFTHGYTDEMKQNFCVHTAQMLRYALYDDLTERPLRFGQSAKQAAAYLNGKANEKRV